MTGAETKTRAEMLAELADLLHEADEQGLRTAYNFLRRALATSRWQPSREQALLLQKRADHARELHARGEGLSAEVALERIERLLDS